MTQGSVGARYAARFSSADTDVAAVQSLRHRMFRPAGVPDGRDIDAADARAQHLLVERATDGALVATARLTVIDGAADLADTYAARHYDLSGFAARAGRMAELGRFCIARGAPDPDILRLAWGAIARRVLEGGVRTLFGCSSFPGADPARHRAAFAFLRARHLGPEAMRPACLAADAVPLPATPPDAVAGRAGLPPLLRSYLAMGGWVGDHAVPDPDLGTCHVFTALDIRAVPPARRASILAAAGLQPDGARNS